MDHRKICLSVIFALSVILLSTSSSTPDKFVQAAVVREPIDRETNILFTNQAGELQDSTLAPDLGVNFRVSVSSFGVEANNMSGRPSISPDGRYVAFQSWASNLVNGDNNGFPDVFLHDRVTGITLRASLADDESQGNMDSYYSAVSANGRYVAFASYASNLVVGDTNNKPDIFLRDVVLGVTTLLSKSTTGGAANGDSSNPSISDDGCRVVFESKASNLVTGDTQMCGAVNCQDIFVWDCQTNQVSRVSLTSSGTQLNNYSYNPAISANGSYVAFDSNATNGPGCNTIAGDYNVFRRDLQANTLACASMNIINYPSGNSTNPSISSDGRYVAFESIAALVAGDTNGFSDTYIRDFQAPASTVWVSQGYSALSNGASSEASISDNGLTVAFLSNASNLIIGDTNSAMDVFLRNLAGNQTYRISLSYSGQQVASGAGYFQDPINTFDGRYVAFSSFSPNHVLNDTNSTYDIFVRDQQAQDLDLRILSIEPIQVIEGFNLVKDKATAIKMEVQHVGTVPANEVSISLEANNQTFNLFYVEEMSNLHSTTDALLSDNVGYPLNFASGTITKTVYFIDDGLTPTSATYQVTGTVDSKGVFAEYLEGNNMDVSARKDVLDTIWSFASSRDLSIIFYKMDWGNTPESTFYDFYTNSNDFLAGVYPIAEENYTPSQGAVELQFIHRPGGYSDLELNWEMHKNSVILTLVHPFTDHFVGVVPPGWFFVNSFVHPYALGMVPKYGVNFTIVESLENHRPPTKYSNLAHEIGHLNGLDLSVEEYHLPDNEEGNPAAEGIFVSKLIPINFKFNRAYYCFMGSTNQPGYWVDSEDYQQLFDQTYVTPIVAPGDRLNSIAPAILAVGEFDITGTVKLDDWYYLPEAELTPLPDGPYAFVYKDGGGTILAQQPFSVTFGLTDGGTSDIAPFAIKIPYVGGTKTIEVQHNTTKLAQKTVSDHTPSISLTAPNGGEVLRGITQVQWSGSDLDGDELHYALLFSLDGGENWEPIAADLDGSSYSWDTNSQPAGDDFMLRVIVTDGFNTSQDTSQSTFTILKSIWLPIVHGR